MTTPAVCLLVAVVACWVGAWLTYCRKTSPWMPVAMVGLSVVLGLCWGLAVRRLDAPATYKYGLAWDAAIVAVYCGWPVLFTDVKLSGLNWVGVLLVVFGLFFLKA